MDATLEKQQIALDIVLSTGRLKQCELHPECIFAGDLDETDHCYGRAMKRFNQGELSQFEDHEELAQHISDMMETYLDIACHKCSPKSEDLRAEVRFMTAKKLEQMAQKVGATEGQIIDCLIEAWPVQQKSLDQLAKVFAYRLGIGSFEDLQGESE